MIIKYWSNGWNYIDNIDMIKVNEYGIEKTFNKIESEGIKIPNRGDFKNLSKVFTDYVIDKSENAISDHIWKNHNKFTDEQKETLFEEEGKNILLSVVTFRNIREDRFEIAMFFNPSFLLNDDGKTIDKL